MRRAACLAGLALVALSCASPGPASAAGVVQVPAAAYRPGGLFGGTGLAGHAHWAMSPRRTFSRAQPVFRHRGPPPEFHLFRIARPAPAMAERTTLADSRPVHAHYAVLPGRRGGAAGPLPAAQDARAPHLNALRIAAGPPDTGLLPHTADVLSEVHARAPPRA